MELVVVAASMVVAGSAAMVSWWCRRPGWVQRVRAERVLVHTVEGQTVEGVLREWSRDGLVLAAAHLVDHGTDLAGEVFVARERVLMIQRHQAGG